MVDLYREHLESQPDSIAVLDQGEATWDGDKYSDRAWLLSGRDVWYSNSYYIGLPQPHPEDDHASEIGVEAWRAEQAAWAAELKEAAEAQEALSDEGLEDCPF